MFAAWNVPVGGRDRVLQGHRLATPTLLAAHAGRPGRRLRIWGGRRGTARLRQPRNEKGRNRSFDLCQSDAALAGSGAAVLASFFSGRTIYQRRRQLVIDLATTCLLGLFLQAFRSAADSQGVGLFLRCV